MGDRKMFPQVKLLQGRENYHSWSIAMKAYLHHEDVWCAVEAPANGAITTDDKNLTKAHSKIILDVDEEVYLHFSDSETAEQIWTKLRSAFDDKGILRGVGLLTQIVSFKLVECPTTSNYVSQIMTIAQKLKATEVELLNHLVAAIMLSDFHQSISPWQCHWRVQTPT